MQIHVNYSTSILVFLQKVNWVKPSKHLVTNKKYIHQNGDRNHENLHCGYRELNRPSQQLGISSRPKRLPNVAEGLVVNDLQEVTQWPIIWVTWPEFPWKVHRKMLGFTHIIWENPLWGCWIQEYLVELGRFILQMTPLSLTRLKRKSTWSPVPCKAEDFLSSCEPNDSLDPLNDGSPPFFGLLNPNSCPIFARKMTMFVDEFLPTVGCIPSSACQRDQKRMEQTLENDPLWQNTMEYAQFFPIVGSQFFLVPSSLHVRLAPPRRIDPCQWICGHAPGAIGQLKAAQLTLLSTLAMKSVSPISPYSILFKVIQMCFFRFDWLTQFCWSVLFWLSQGWTARTLDLPMKIIGFWAQSQQQREHWSSKARGNELKMCMWSGNGWGCKQWISVM